MDEGRKFYTRLNQRWILDALIGIGGWDILHPTIRGFSEETGYYHGDVDRVFSKVGSTQHLPEAFSTTAQEVEIKARWSEARGFRLGAADLYARAMVLYGRAQYGFYSDHPLKKVFHGKSVQCFEKMVELGIDKVERVILDFEGKKLYGIYSAPPGNGPFPLLMLGPGMDMFKEDWVFIMKRYFIPMGFACIAFDGPGQGESLLHGLKMTLDNYERAASAFFDWAEKRKEVDPKKFVFLGVSYGCYTAHRIAAYDKRLKAFATGMSTFGNFWYTFETAQPNFKLNHMYMTGYTDEEKYNEEIMYRMPLGDLVKKVECPNLITHGEYDELTKIDEVFESFEKTPPPKELWVYGREYHPMGGVGRDFLSNAGDWLIAALDGKFPQSMDRRVFFGKDGNIIEGTGQPYWWSPK